MKFKTRMLLTMVLFFGLLLLVTVGSRPLQVINEDYSIAGSIFTVNDFFTIFGLFAISMVIVDIIVMSRRRKR